MSLSWNRTIFTVIVIGLTTALLSRSAGAQSADAAPGQGGILLQMKWLPQAQFAGYYVALEKGFYDKHGVPGPRVDYMPVQDAAMEPLFSGHADFCVEWLPNALVQRDHGHDVVCLLQLFQKSSLVFLAHQGQGITSVKDLQGRPVQVWMNEAGKMPKLFLKLNGVEPELIPCGSSLSPFLRKAVAAITTTRYNEYHKVLEGGVRPEELFEIVPADHGFDYPEDGLYCTGKTWKERPDLCRNVARASLEGWAYALDPQNERETVAILMKKAHEAKHITNDNHQTYMLRKVRDYVVHRVGDDPDYWGRLSEKDYRQTVELLEKAGVISTSVPYKEFHPYKKAVK